MGFDTTRASRIRAAAPPRRPRLPGRGGRAPAAVKSGAYATGGRVAKKSTALREEGGISERPSHKESPVAGARFGAGCEAGAGAQACGRWSAGR